MVEDACNRAEHLSPEVAIDRLFEDRSTAGVSGEKRFDIGLQRAIIAAHLPYEGHALVDATGDRRIEDLFHAHPALGLVHVDCS
jgi:hypothetical protein